jgi:Zn-dependent peptidase ImmA (M78 family)/transcriptional regulator with XRE-family HTH domain
MDGIKINHNILKFFREKFGFSNADVVCYAKIHDIKEKKDRPAMTAIEYLNGIENGNINPSKLVLESLSKLYHVPFLTFFLPNLPVFIDTLIDFRTFDSKQPPKDNPVIFAIKRKVKLLQEELSGIEKEMGQKEKDFVSSVESTLPIVDFVALVREKLDFSLDEQKKVKKDDLFKTIRKRVESLGIFVIQVGNLGNYLTKIETSDFRGIAISDKYAPLIVINSNDTPAAQLFSLLHELAHIFLGHTSISNVGIMDYADNTEQICNAFAAEFLLPKQEIVAVKNINDINEILSTAETIASQYKISLMVVIRRLFDSGKITKESFNKANGIIASNTKIKKVTGSNGGGPNKNVVDKAHLGERTINVIGLATERQLISPTTAAAILGVNISRLYKMVP